MKNEKQKSYNLLFHNRQGDTGESIHKLERLNQLKVVSVAVFDL